MIELAKPGFEPAVGRGVPPSLATNTSRASVRREAPEPGDSDDASNRHIAASNAEAQSRTNPLRGAIS